MNIASIIDHTNLNPDASAEDITKLCEEARKFGFASVCVNSSYVPLASSLLDGSDVKVCSVVGFPLGSCLTESKAFEASCAASHGASEIDMVINLSWLKDGEDEKVKNDIASVVQAVPGCIVKVIIETCLLTDAEKIKACLLAKEAGAHFVKTSTGFSKGGAAASDVRLMRETVGEGMGVKASGGIRDRIAAEEMISAGADRLGTSKSVYICR